MCKENARHSAGSLKTSFYIAHFILVYVDALVLVQTVVIFSPPLEEPRAPPPPSAPIVAPRPFSAAVVVEKKVKVKRTTAVKLTNK